MHSDKQIRVCTRARAAEAVCKDSGRSKALDFLVRNLQYLETPQYLRKRLFSLHAGKEGQCSGWRRTQERKAGRRCLVKSEWRSFACSLEGRLEVRRSPASPGRASPPSPLGVVAVSRRSGCTKDGRGSAGRRGAFDSRTLQPNTPSRPPVSHSSLGCSSDPPGRCGWTFRATKPSSAQRDSPSQPGNEGGG